MRFSSLSLPALVLQNTLVGAASVRRFEPWKAAECHPGSSRVVFEHLNARGWNTKLCLINYEPSIFDCHDLDMKLEHIILTYFVEKVADWVYRGVGTESADGPPQRPGPPRPPKAGQKPPRDELDPALATWGDLYAYHASRGSLKWEPTRQASRLVATTDATVADPVTDLSVMELHEDGFSFSAVPRLFKDPNSDWDYPAPIPDRPMKCPVQMHVHYWAAAGQEKTILPLKNIAYMVEMALINSFSNSFFKSCYEMTRNWESWDGYLRVCFNANQTQTGCFTCGGHND